MSSLPSSCPTAHAGLLAWVDEITALVQPQAVRWCDGSVAERDQLLAMMEASGAAIRLSRPGSWLFRSHPSDVARVEDRTVIACRSRDDAGPTNNWCDPEQLRATMRGLFAGCMAGRTLYVVPFAMAPEGSPLEIIGVELTDSPYVVVSMGLMARMGRAVLDRLGGDGAFVPCLHSLGAPLAEGASDSAWPCAPMERKYIAHFPEDRTVWSFGSGYGGNALLGKKCLALRLGSWLAREQGWMAEHMLILALTAPSGKTYHIAAAFPSACGKTNLAMLRPTLPGWTVRCLGDDIAWMRIGADGRLWAVNPEHGFFGVAPGTSPATNPAAMATIGRDTLFTNVALTPDGDVWWEGLGPAPATAIDWQGQPWQPGCGRVAAHGNARFTVAAGQCPVIDPRWQDPQGVPIDVILFGGRRPGIVPLVTEALSWEHGVTLGSAIGSETTAATIGQAGLLRRDPFAMLPFCGYHMGDYCQHWLDMGARLGAKAPRIFSVNWFRKDAAGRWLWPGFGDNCRVLAWIAARLEGTAVGRTTPLGILPAAGELNLDGLALAPGDLDQLIGIDRAGWLGELAAIDTFHGRLAPRLPAALTAEVARMRAGLAAD
jgi:phosphoenolpyruvate carboxykinase (GTP)